jgi:4-hydroxy-3-methylbut-2-enyl diphosphate reductase
MKLALALSLLAASTEAFAPPHMRSRTALNGLKMSTTQAEQEERARTKKEERLRFMKNEQFHRKGFKEVREGVEKTMGTQFESELVEQFKTNDFVIERDGVKVHLAKVRSFV